MSEKLALVRDFLYRCVAELSDWWVRPGASRGGYVAGAGGGRGGVTDVEETLLHLDRAVLVLPEETHCFLAGDAGVAVPVSGEDGGGDQGALTAET